MTDLELHESLGNVDIGGWQSYRFKPGAVIPVNDALDMLSIGLQPMYIRRRVDGSSKVIYKDPPGLGYWFDVANYSAVILALSAILWTIHLVIK